MEKEFDVLLEHKEKKSYHIPGILNDKKDFDGPLDLLLFLIQENNANIYDLPIALITDQFLDYIEHNKTDLPDLADFYRTAAELLYIKSKLLLPQVTELDQEYQDPRKDLVDKLLDYQKFKKYTDLLTGVDSGDRLYINRPENFFAIPFEDKDLFKGVTLTDLCATFSSILAKTPPSKIFNIYEEVSVHEKKALMLELLDQKENITIEDLIVDYTNPLHIICAFLAILECVKDHLILFSQKVLYGPIYIERRPIDWDPALIDRYDMEADEYVKHDLSDPEDFTILTPEAEMKLDDMIKKEQKEEKELDVFIGDEEEVMLEDDDE